MIKKSYNKNKSNCKVTFQYSPEESETIETIQVLGNFNLWGDEKKLFLKKRKDGTFSNSINLAAQNEYEFRYLINEKTWITDKDADRCVWNIYGSQNALIEI